MTFTRDDGQEIAVVSGFRNLVLTYRKRQTPLGDWSDDNYKQAARKRLKRSKRLIETLKKWKGDIKDAAILEVGCGDGINTLLFGLQGAKRAVGIDLDLRLGRQDERGEAARRLADFTIKAMGVESSLEKCCSNHQVELLTMDATQMEFPDKSFDLVLSRSVLEHIQPIEKLFSEIARVIRPQGVVYHEIDPFFWIRGCHKRGLVDMPWAHARLTPDEYHRFITENENESKAQKRLNRLMTLNRQTVKEWKMLFESSPFEIIDWREEKSSFAEEVLGEYPEVISTLLPGIEANDLVTSRIRVVLRK